MCFWIQLLRCRHEFRECSRYDISLRLNLDTNPGKPLEDGKLHCENAWLKQNVKANLPQTLLKTYTAKRPNDADVDAFPCLSQDFDDDCPPLELAGYRLVLRGSWSGNIEVAIQISVKHCAHLCTADPACLGFSLHVQNRHGSDGRGLCSHYEKAGDPKPSDSCTYAFSKAGSGVW